jgi:hypothetical protein
VSFALGSVATNLLWGKLYGQFNNKKLSSWPSSSSKSDPPFAAGCSPRQGTGEQHHDVCRVSRQHACGRDQAWTRRRPSVRENRAVWCSPIEAGSLQSKQSDVPMCLPRASSSFLEQAVRTQCVVDVSSSSPAVSLGANSHAPGEPLTPQCVREQSSRAGREWLVVGRTGGYMISHVTMQHKSADPK